MAIQRFGCHPIATLNKTCAPELPFGLRKGSIACFAALALLGDRDACKAGVSHGPGVLFSQRSPPEAAPGSANGDRRLGSPFSCAFCTSLERRGTGFADSLPGGRASNQHLSAFSACSPAASTSPQSRW